MKLKNSSGSEYKSGTWTNQNVYMKLNNGYASGMETTTTWEILTGPETGTISTGTKTLTKAGTYTIKVTTTKKSGGSSSSNYTVKIDNTPPTATISLSSSKITKGDSVTATVNLRDNNTDDSGVDITKCKYILNTSSSTPSSYTGTFSSSSQQLTFTPNPTSTTNYYLHVLTTDKAGNVKETISSAINVHVHDIQTTSYWEEYQTCSHYHTSVDGTLTDATGNGYWVATTPGACYQKQESCYSIAGGIGTFFATGAKTDNVTSGHVCSKCGKHAKDNSGGLWKYEWGRICNTCSNVTHAFKYSDGWYCSLEHFEATQKGHTDNCWTTYYDLSCTLGEGEDSCTRLVTEYKCSGCNKTNTYKPADTSYCTICNQYHSKPASGTPGL